MLQKYTDKKNAKTPTEWEKHLQIINLMRHIQRIGKKNLLELDNEKHQDPIWQINNQME